MTELDLPRGPAELLEAVRRPLAEHLGGEERIRLGGGTALAARWAHRHSRDVDLFVDHDAYSRLFRNADRFSADIERHVGSVEQLGVGHNYAIIVLRDGEITVLAAPSLTDKPISGDIVRGTQVRVESNAEILAKKLVHRLADYHIFVPRDLYDVAVARRLDPHALEAALAVIPSPSLEDLCRELAVLSHSPDWGEAHSQPLLQPAHRQDAADSAAIVERVIERHLSRRSPAVFRCDARPPHGS